MIGGLVVFAIAASLVGIRFGARPITWADMMHAFIDYRGPTALESPNEIVVRTFYFPRTIVGLVIGAALGVAGALMQGFTRNPLADPGLLGINSGAGLAASLAVVLGGSDLRDYVWWALLGAGLAGAAVYAMGSFAGGATPVSLALAGAIVAALTGAVTASLMVIRPQQSVIAQWWLAGSLGGRKLDDLWHIAPLLVVGFAIALACGRALNGLSLGDDVARSLGQRVALSRAAIALAVVLLAGASVALAGVIGFLGLIAPHIARALIGPDYRWLVPASATLGASLLVLVDVAARMVVRPGEVSIGVTMALVGAPFFIAVARRKTLREL